MAPSVWYIMVFILPSLDVIHVCFGSRGKFGHFLLKKSCLSLAALVWKLRKSTRTKLNSKIIREKLTLRYKAFLGLVQTPYYLWAVLNLYNWVHKIGWWKLELLGILLALVRRELRFPELKINGVWIDRWDFVNFSWPKYEWRTAHGQYGVWTRL